MASSLGDHRGLLKMHMLFITRIRECKRKNIGWQGWNWSHILYKKLQLIPLELSIKSQNITLTHIYARCLTISATSQWIIPRDILELAMERLSTRRVRARAKTERSTGTICGGGLSTYIAVKRLALCTAGRSREEWIEIWGMCTLDVDVLAYENAYDWFRLNIDGL